MKILYVLPSLANKGPIIVAKNLVDVMISHGHECRVVYFDEKKELEFNCPTYKVIGWEFDFSSYDIVHSHGLRPDLFVYLNRKKKGRAKLITTAHNYVFQDLRYEYNPLYALIFGFLWILLFRGFDKVAVLSKDALNYYSHFLCNKKLEVAYNTSIITDEDIDNSDKAILKKFKGVDDIIIGTNALLTKRKGIDMLINALNQLPHYKLVVIGDGKALNQLKKLAIKRNVNDRVLFLGYRKNAYRYLNYYDLFAVPSRSEGFGLTILEAGIKNKSVIVSDLPIFKELFSESEVSFFKLENISSLANAIIYAHKNYDIGKKLHERYLNCYSPKCFYNSYIRIYNE